MQGKESVWNRWPEVLPWTVLVASACILAALIICLPLNVDELEFHRATRWVGQGQMPYRDFWEHHTPLQWFLFAPVTRLFKDASATNILALRWVQIPLEVLTVLVLVSLMRRRGVRWPVVPLALGPILSSRLIGSPMVGYRIDTLMNLLFLTGLTLLEWDADRRSEALEAFCVGSLHCPGLFMLSANASHGPLGPRRLLRGIQARWARTKMLPSLANPLDGGGGGRGCLPGGYFPLEPRGAGGVFSTVRKG